MDKVLYAIENKTLGYDAAYSFILFLFVLQQGMHFEDIIIKEYCIHNIAHQGKSNIEQQAVLRVIAIHKR
jgi:hypothetical protein